MPNTRTSQQSFSGGVVTPEFWGQIADAKYQAGLADCVNFLVAPHGPISNRPGTSYVWGSKDSTKKSRLVPFKFSSDESFAVEIGAGYFRFYSNGGVLLHPTASAWSNATAYTVGALVDLSGTTYYCKAANTNQSPPNASYWYALPSTGEYEIPNGYAEADLFEITYAQSYDVLTFAHQNYAPAELKRYGNTDWRFGSIAFTPSLVSPHPIAVTPTLASSPSNMVVYEYLVTAIGSNTADESIANKSRTNVTTSISSATNASPGVFTSSTAHKMIIDQKVYVSATFASGSVSGLFMVNTSSTPTFTIKTTSGDVVDTSALGAFVSGNYEPVGVVNNLLQSGSKNTITWDEISGAVRYNVYKKSSGLFGYIGQTDSTSFIDDNITADLSQTAPEENVPFTGSGNYPGALSYFEQRRCFAGTINKPQNFWATRSGTESNLNYSIPARDDDSVSFRVAARELNTIRHIIPLASLILLTESAEWRVGSSGETLTPSTVSVRPQSYNGANMAQPAVVNNNVVYVASAGGHARELGYADTSGGYVSGDLSVRAPHLFDDYTVTQMAVTRTPYPVVWFVRSDGKLVGLTYMPEQQIAAFHLHETDGLFESVCSIPEGNDDVLYFVINRDGERFIERMGARRFAEREDAYFVDCGLSYSGSAVSEISGLDHLEGKTVSILADGCVAPRQMVIGGKVTLENPASKVVVGLPYNCDMTTLPLALQLPGYGQGRMKNINQVFMRVNRTSGIFVGPDFDSLTEVKPRTNELYGVATKLKTEEISIRVKPVWDDGGQVSIRQSDPLPITIMSMSIEVAIGG